MFKLSGHFWDQLCHPASAYCSSIDWLIDWHVVSCWRRWMVIVYRVFYKEVWVKIVAHETESLHLPSVLWRCWLGDMHMTQLMPLPLTVTCFSKIQIGFTFLVPAHPGSPGERPINRVCVWVKIVAHETGSLRLYCSVYQLVLSVVIYWSSLVACCQPAAVAKHFVALSTNGVSIAILSSISR